MSDSRWSRRFDTATQAMAVVAAFTLPLPTPLISVAMILLVAFWLASGNFGDKFRRIRANPVAIAALILFGLFVIGMFYTSVDLATALRGLNKYRKLLYIAVIISALHEESWRRRAYWALLASILVVMTLTYGILIGLLPLGPPGQEYTIFKGRIAWPWFLAFATFLMAHHFTQEPGRRWLWGILILLAVNNLLFMISGRTGQITLLALVLLFAFQKWRWRGLIPGAMVAAIVLGVGLTYSDIIRKRLETEFSVHQSESDPDLRSTSMRVNLYRYTPQIIAEHPLFGVGTGGFSSAYAQKTKTHNVPATDNPHNEYLMIGSQLGLVGLTAFLFIGYRQWRNARSLPAPYDTAAQGLVVAMAVGCLFNSFLLNHWEGHFYVIVSGILFSGLSPAPDAAPMRLPAAA